MFYKCSKCHSDLFELTEGAYLSEKSLGYYTTNEKLGHTYIPVCETCLENAFDERMEANSTEIWNQLDAVLGEFETALENLPVERKVSDILLELFENYADKFRNIDIHTK